MRVLYVSTEVQPALKTGGLADVNAALPAALVAAGADLRLLFPGFPALLDAATARGRPHALGPAFGSASVALLPCRLGAVPALLVDAPERYDRAGNPYVDARGRDWPDNAERFALLAWAAACAARDGVAGWRPDIVHSHDWHAGLTSAYLRASGAIAPATVFTVHNLSFQGLYPPSILPSLGLPAAYYGADGIEFYGQVNFLKAGLVYSDRLTTVSPGFASEIQTPEFGCGLDGLLRARADVLTGILNGIDEHAWDPARDPDLPARYSAVDLAGKAACKQALRAAHGLDPACTGPLIGVVSRLTPQKGLDLLLDCVPAIVSAGGQVSLLGSGDDGEERAWRAAARAHPGSVAVHIGYDEALAHRIFAAADVVAVPSRFEPCGLTQLYAMRYGALPLVRRTGGLADTVVDAGDGERATGFVFDAANAQALGTALARMFALWRATSAWQRVQQQAMRQHFGWAEPARRYLALYRSLRPAA